MFLSILIAAVLEGVSSLYMTPSDIVKVSNGSKSLRLAFLIKTTHFRESQLSLRFGTTINFVDLNNSGSGKVGIVRAAIHLCVPGYVLLFPPKMLSGWKKNMFFGLLFQHSRPLAGWFEPAAPIGLGPYSDRK